MVIRNLFLVFATFFICTQALPLNSTFTQENYFMQDRKEGVPVPITNIVINIFGKDTVSELLNQKPVEEPIKEEEKDEDEALAKNPFLSLFSRQFTKRNIDPEDAALNFKPEAKVEKREVIEDEVQEIASENSHREKRQNAAADFFKSLGDVQLILGTFQAVGKPINGQSLSGLGNQPFFGDIFKNFNSLNIPGMSG